MTTKKKTTTTKSATTKAKSVSEPTAATMTVQPNKKELAKAVAEAQAAAPAIIASVAPAAEAPVAPALATSLAQSAAPAMPITVSAAPKAEQTVEKSVAAAQASKPLLTIGMFQKRLHEQGCYDGAWDGHYGPMTKSAVRRFQAAKGLPTDGEPTPATLAALGF